MKGTHLPPGCGLDLGEPLLYQEHQQRFQAARRMRFCLNCRTMGSMDTNSRFTCAECGTEHNGRWGNLTAPRAYNNFLVLAGRGGGKTLIGAFAALEEIQVPDSVGWVMGPDYKKLHDSTFPTLVRRIPPHWVKKWDSEHMEITFVNNAMVAFRSLEDPERARGPHGVNWGWFDEAAQSPERAYHVFKPTLIKAGGIVIATTTVLGYDWTYEQIEQQALVYNEPGFWACRYHTADNPLFRTNPVMRERIESDRRRMPPAFFAQEYESERSNAEGLIYGQLIDKQTLRTVEDVRRHIPEWPDIHPTRSILVGLDSGADHPFGAVMIVVTPSGLIVVDDYLERMQAISQQIAPIHIRFGLHRFSNITWAGNKNEANLRLEFGLKGIGVGKAENKHEVGIQRVQSWLYAGQLFFVKGKADRTIAQMKAYRYAENTANDGQKRDKERVFKLKDELPDGIRYALMLYPELPKEFTTPKTQSPEEAEMMRWRWETFPQKVRDQIERTREYEKRLRGDNTVLMPSETNYPIGDFYGVEGGRDDWPTMGHRGQ